MPTHNPGTLVCARGREWIVLSGSEDDQTWIHIPLESDPVTEATFPPPNPLQKAGHEGALLLRDALLLSLRRGAGPFRSFGQLAIEPRAYQRAGRHSLLDSQAVYPATEDVFSRAMGGSGQVL